jgi:hypothetical protein
MRYAGCARQSFSGLRIFEKKGNFLLRGGVYGIWKK